MEGKRLLFLPPDSRIIKVSAPHIVEGREEGGINLFHLDSHQGRNLLSVCLNACTSRQETAVYLLMEEALNNFYVVKLSEEFLALPLSFATKKQGAEAFLTPAVRKMRFG